MLQLSACSRSIALVKHATSPAQLWYATVFVHCFTNTQPCESATVTAESGQAISCQKYAKLRSGRRINSAKSWPRENVAGGSVLTPEMCLRTPEDLHNPYPGRIGMHSFRPREEREREKSLERRHTEPRSCMFPAKSILSTRAPERIYQFFGFRYSVSCGLRAESSCTAKHASGVVRWSSIPPQPPVGLLSRYAPWFGRSVKDNLMHIIIIKRPAKPWNILHKLTHTHTHTHKHTSWCCVFCWWLFNVLLCELLTLFVILTQRYNFGALINPHLLAGRRPGAGVCNASREICLGRKRYGRLWGLLLCGFAPFKAPFGKILN